MTRAFVIAAIPLLCLWAHAETSAWAVSDPHANKIFLLGTSHVLRASDYPLPGAFDSAYEAAETIVLEAPMDAMKQPDIQMKLLQATLLQGTTVQDALTAESYRQLKAYCHGKGIPLMALQQLKPGMLCMTLTIMEMQALGLSLEGVDAHYLAQAKADNKQVEALESIEFAIGMIADFGEGEEDELVQSTVEDLATLKEEFPKVIAAWRKGDLKALDELLMVDMRKKFPKLYKRLLTERNSAWLPKLEAYLESPAVEAVFVGGGHMVGEAGLLAMLRAKGYTVRPFTAETQED